MDSSREELKSDLLRFLRSIQRAGVPVDMLGEDEPLVPSGLIDSLAILQIVSYLEDTYQIDFSTTGIDPEQLGSVRNILAVIEKKKK